MVYPPDFYKIDWSAVSRDFPVDSYTNVPYSDVYVIVIVSNT